MTKNCEELCLEDGCDRPVWARGRCNSHNRRAAKLGLASPPKKPCNVAKEFSKSRQLTAVEAAYFAGYFDGEGCVCVSSPNCGNRYVYVTFSQTQPTVLLELKSIYGGALWFRPAKGNDRPQIRYRLQQYHAVTAFLIDVFPYLREKKDQVKLVLDSFSHTLPDSDLSKLRHDLSSLKERIGARLEMVNG